MRAARTAPSASTGLNCRGRFSAVTIASAIMSGVELANSIRRPGAVTIEPMGDVEVLLEMVLEREVEEGRSGRGQLHAGRETALHQRQIAGRQMPVEIRHESAHLDTGRRIQ